MEENSIYLQKLKNKNNTVKNENITERVVKRIKDVCYTNDLVKEYIEHSPFIEYVEYVDKLIFLVRNFDEEKQKQIYNSPNNLIEELLGRVMNIMILYLDYDPLYDYDSLIIGQINFILRQSEKKGNKL